MECIVVSYCLSKSGHVDQVKYIFHFRGYFAGSKVEEIRVIGKNEEFLIGAEYILHLRILKTEQNTLVCSCLRKRNLEEISTDFL